MKKLIKQKFILALAAAALISTACNTTQFSKRETSDNKTNVVSIVNSRWFWNNEGYTVQLSNDTASITAAKSGTDNATIQAIVAGAVQGAVQGAVPGAASVAK
jgi:Flp pilus assembly protein TadG